MSFAVTSPEDDFSLFLVDSQGREPSRTPHGKEPRRGSVHGGSVMQLSCTSLSSSDLVVLHPLSIDVRFACFTRSRSFALIF